MATQKEVNRRWLEAVAIYVVDVLPVDNKKDEKAKQFVLSLVDKRIMTLDKQIAKYQARRKKKQ